MVEKPHLFIRTEASNQIGMGHFMRCFSIAEAARRVGIPVTFLLNSSMWGIAAKCGKIGAFLQTVPDFGQDLASLRSVLLPTDWLLIDSYKVNSEYLSELHSGTQIAIIDDLDALERYDCDFLINSAMAAPRQSYAEKSNANLLLGPDYALIRDEFLRKYPPGVAGVSVAIMFGGSDPTGLSLVIAKVLHSALPDVTIKIIVGPANLQVVALKELEEELPRLKLFLSPAKVVKVLAGCDLVITAAGGSVGEVAAMGLPALVLVVYDNQAAALKACPYPVIDARGGLPGDLGDQVKALMADPQTRAAIAKSAHALVDGKGPWRIVEAMFGV